MNTSPPKKNQKTFLKLKHILEFLPLGVSLIAPEDRRRIYANAAFLKFFRGTSLTSLEDITGLRTEDYHLYNPLQSAAVDCKMARLEQNIMARGGPGYDLYDQSVILPQGKGFICYDAFLRPIEANGQCVALVWYFHETSSLQNSDRVFEAYTTTYRERGREKEGARVFLNFFALQDLLQEQHRTKPYVGVLLGKLCRDRALHMLERMRRSNTTLRSYAARINSDLKASGVVVRDVRRHVEAKLRKIGRRKDATEEGDILVFRKKKD